MKDQRVPVTVFVKLNDVPGTHTSAIGADGASLVTNTRPPLGSELDVSLLWDDVTYHATGRVAEHTAEGVDLHFEESTARFKNAVASLLSEIVPPRR